LAARPDDVPLLLLLLLLLLLGRFRRRLRRAPLVRAVKHDLRFVVVVGAVIVVVLVSVAAPAGPRCRADAPGLGEPALLAQLLEELGALDGVCFGL